jgi:hypothetical protein
MSGGHWNYRQETLGDSVALLLDDVATDRDIVARFPRLARILSLRATTFHDELQAMRNVLHDLDMDLSGDVLIANDRGFENDAIERLTAGMVEKPACSDMACEDEFCPFEHAE